MDRLGALKTLSILIPIYKLYEPRGPIFRSSLFDDVQFLGKICCGGLRFETGHVDVIINQGGIQNRVNKRYKANSKKIISKLFSVFILPKTGRFRLHYHEETLRKVEFIPNS